ncbi:MAG: hypothetical protein LIO93_01500 [Bacteroidales bacterium]|nr:hypothetical protein [Bacteroidales bacterium]
MKKILFILSLMLLSYGFISAQGSATVELTIEATGNSDENNKKPIPALKTNEEWTVTATTLYKGEASGYWGSRLFSIQMENSTEEFPGFEFYIRPQDFSGTGGQIGVNNKYGLLNTEPLAIDAFEGTEITFEIVSDGTGLITSTTSANGSQWVFEKTVDPAIVLYYDYVQAAQNYDVEVVIEYYPEYLSVTPTSLDFGALVVGESSADSKLVSIIGSSDYTDPFSFSIKAEEGLANSFVYLEDNFSSEAGGQLEFLFNPQSEGNQRIILTVTRGDESRTVEIEGVGVRKSPVEADT